MFTFSNKMGPVIENTNTTEPVRQSLNSLMYDLWSKLTVNIFQRSLFVIIHYLLVSSSIWLWEGFGVFDVSNKKFSYSKINSMNFNGETFYEKYKDAEFLKDETNVQNILRKQGELEQFMNDLKPGDSFQVEGMFLKPGSPLIITKSDRVDERDVDVDAFTPRRLSGLTAAYVLDNASKFPEIYSSEAEDLGISWSTDDRDQQLTYLSAVSGAEYFVKHFYWGPLVCGIKKYQLKLITAERLIEMTKIRSQIGERMSTRLMRTSKQSHYSISKLFAKLLTLGDTFDHKEAMKSLPEEIRCMIE